MTTSDPMSRRGRPPRIDKSAITEAVLAIGTANVTMRGVAQHLGVSLPGLYHHVKNQDELLRLATQAAFAQCPPPRYTGEHWATWLHAYASYIRTVLVAEPALVEKFVGGGVPVDGEMEYIAHALDTLCEQGLTPDEAITVLGAVTAMAIGSASETHRENVHAGRGHPWLARIFQLTARSDPSRYPALRALANSGYDPFDEPTFHERIALLLSGIATQYGLPPEPG
ncbi:TetR/AcrR family transcriptional regulator C-terminal domain-containing protein [Nocardia alni]|uniref:TetR/AcrR family transcriptional regulator C-terminal domain-containing protein n=1 Tax=Nocardia alni TaxID=2815723 RepID=UPI001C22F4B1|nr:TetR/AcrR family transcriptional regulator C-terminal domain-containing protein [Nocardia alni]